MPATGIGLMINKQLNKKLKLISH